MSLNNPATPGVSASYGSYVGNSTLNKAIPHGLGKIPSGVIWIHASAGGWIVGGIGSIFGLESNVQYATAVTAPNATNFYVGNDNKSANLNGQTYYWGAFG